MNDEPFEIAYQFRGTGWKRKTFKSKSAFEKWLDKIMEKEGAAPDIRVADSP